MFLLDLENGDQFVSARDKKILRDRTVYIVYGNPVFNSGHGSATRNCCKKDGTIVSKSCLMEVVKTGESINKEKIMAMFEKVKQHTKPNG